MRSQKTRPPTSPLEIAVSATDPDNVENPNTDELTYSLQGHDAASFNIDSSTGQIKTKAALDFETKSTYHVAVFVRDSKDYTATRTPWTTTA